MTKYPKIIVVGPNAFSAISNSGKTLESMFKNWGMDNIAQIYSGAGEKPDFQFCKRYYRITIFDIIKSITCFRRNYCGAAVVENSQILPAKQVEKSRIIEIFKKWHDYLFFVIDAVWRLGTWRTKDFHDWIEEFSPEAVFLHAGPNGHNHFVAWYIAKKYNLPLFCYSTDDYFAIRSSNSPLAFVRQFYRRMFFQKTFKRARKCFVIGEYMAEEYEKIFQKKFYSVMNCVPEVFLPEASECHVPFSIVFIGGVHLRRWEALAEFGRMVNAYSVAYAFSVEIKIYCAQNLDEKVIKALNVPPLRFAGKLAPEEVFQAMADADALCHVESCDSKCRRQTRMSVSTKLPEYFMSGRPVIAWGPHEIASMILLEKHNLGMVLSDQDTHDAIMKKLDVFFTDAAGRRNMERVARQFAETHFAGDKVRALFEAELLEGR